jgi:hypothetical protein
MEVKVFTDDLPSAAACLERFDVLAGVGIRHLLYALRLDPDRFHLADLAPPQKRVALENDRFLPVTAELLIASTTGLREPLGHPERTLALLARGDSEAARRRLEGDLGSLHAFYRYCVLHQAACLRLGPTDVYLWMDWRLPGDRWCFDLVDEARDAARDLDVITEPIVDSRDLWTRARRCSVREESQRKTVIRDRRTGAAIDQRDIHAARLAPPAVNT